jgi:hypothetical protein
VAVGDGVSVGTTATVAVGRTNGETPAVAVGRVAADCCPVLPNAYPTTRSPMPNASATRKPMPNSIPVPNPDRKLELPFIGNPPLQNLPSV